MTKRTRLAAPTAASPWTKRVAIPRTQGLARNETADVCIVGAGIAGLTTAHLLAEAGQTVVVVDDGPIGRGMTSATSAHLSNAIDAGYTEIEQMHGERGAQIVAASHSAAIDRIETIVHEHRIACDFARVDGYLYRGDSDTDLEAELKAAHRAGLIGVTMVPRAPLDGFDTGPCLEYPGQGQFHPLKYLAGLVRAIVKAGGRVYTNTHAETIQGGPSAQVTSGNHTIATGAVVVATNTPVNDLVAIHTKQAPYMTYVLGLRIPRGSVPQALYWDTEDPYHYVRVYSPGATSPFDLLIVGGEDHKSGQADDTAERHGRLETWARERFPMIDSVEFVWGGQVMEPVDGVAFIGRNPLDSNNVYIATGDAGMGLTHGTIAGILLTDLVLGRANEWAALYDPARKPLRAPGEYLKEAANMAAQYTTWVTGGDVETVDQIARGSGAVVRRGLSKVAVYRDERGVLHERSAVCTHLGCIVRWNEAENTWDCPCHGSRFDKLGDVINGPANRGLTPVSE
jgi:glycine/D-amino acid oxidase-like deaminating enzyme/nitrite reductase/ring-hydroxylating ferredoxin subunit